mmetsp:Transcript_16614/g.29558  ORF Transcript_16614/g.29558 Transcript_16614/m.29558 type:complete len:98 (-) Transcript_16614:1139-1432(-)
MSKSLSNLAMDSAGWNGLRSTFTAAVAEFVPSRALMLISGDNAAFHGLLILRSCQLFQILDFCKPCLILVSQLLRARASIWILNQHVFYQLFQMWFH